MKTNLITKEIIFKKLEENKEKISSYGVKKIGLFGSYIRNEQKKGSDLDFLIEFDKRKKTYHNFMEVNKLMKKLFKQKIDIITKESLSPHIGSYIKKEVKYA